MKDKGAETGADSGTAKGGFNDAMEAMHPEQTQETLNRTELMQKTGAELAQLASPFSSQKLSTLARKPKTFLVDIIMGQGMQKDAQPKARAHRVTSEAEGTAKMIVEFLDGAKKQRDQNGFNPVITNFFQTQFTNYIDEGIEDGTINPNKTNKALLLMTGFYLVFDSFIGFKNAPSLYAQIKEKFKRKPKTVKNAEPTE